MNKEPIKQKKTNNTKKEFQFVVGIGASAGGLEALQKLLSSLPPDTGFPFIIIQHLSPDYKSLLGEILGKQTEMPVIQAEEGMEIQANCVYVIQPGKNMCLADNKLLLTDQKEKELNLPIDMFFRSLAKEAGSRAIAVVLSGTGSDGSNGIKDIKEHDGMVIIQDYESSKFDGMPRSAMRTGLADIQASPEEIALELRHISNTAIKLPQTIKTDRQIDEELMKKVYIILKKISNVNFTQYKQTTIIRRIERRMMLAHKDTLKDYVDFLYESPEEVKTLSREVLIGVTNFFRDPDYFQCLKDRAIQDIIMHSSENESIRVWVAGCSTGEEAYSIAILFTEVMETLKIQRNVKIFATDLDYDAITTAGKGIYGDNIVDSVSQTRLSRYFSRKNNTYVINREIRKMIVFSPHNVFQDPPFGRLDLISCRNMLIYFQPVLQNDLFALFHQSLKDGGYLFLGKSEAIGAFTDAFPVVDAAAKIFTHRSNIKIPGSKSVPFLQTAYLDDDIASGDRDSRFSAHGIADEPNITSDKDKLDSSMFEQFMPASLVINEQNNITRLYGDITNYIHFSTGEFSNNVFDLITEALKIPASTILKEAREKKGKVQYKDINFRGEREVAAINMTAMPVSKQNGDYDSLYALVLTETGTKNELKNAVIYDIDRVSSQRITDLEQELADIHGKLSNSVANQECINEELQAANEELLTANEELQSSNEELQSVNEELYTVNSEYQQKLSELAGVNDDIANFLSSTLTGIIFVDNKLNIRRYTDYVTSEFSVMEHDIGRSLKFISYHFPTVDITEICENVLKNLIPDEREITTSKNKTFFIRVTPYRSTENKILGCVITFIDITKQKQGQVKLETTEKKLTVARESMEAKSDYLTRIAYEIKTPMSALSGLIKNISQQTENKEQMLNSLKKMNETIEYMTSIVTDIFEVSRTEHGAITQIEEPFVLSEIIDNISNKISEQVIKSELSFETSISGDLSKKYLGNSTAIQQILMNILNNSLKYTPKGGSIKLNVYEDKEIAENDDTATLAFVISDTGMGINKDFLPNVFKPFAQENEKETIDPTSMGLGLSIVKKLVDSMNGEISVDSKAGEGSTFYVRLKLKKLNDESIINIIPQPEVRLAGLNVLVAEDNSLNRTILCNILKNEGMTCVEAVNGEEAVKKFIDSPEGFFDIILMDMRMPKMDGIKASQMIRSSEKSDAMVVPIVGVSANGFSEDVRKAYDAGIIEYTTKPINRESLLRIIRSLCANFK